MANITGNVIDQHAIPVPNTVIRLMGGSQTPQATLTAIDGSFSFNNLPPGTYTVSAIWRQSIVDQAAELTPGQAEATVVRFKVLTAPLNGGLLSSIDTNRYVLLKYGQYAFMAFIGWFFFNRLVAQQIPDLSLTKLTNLETARGIITYLVAVTTMSMAAILMLAAIMTGGKDLDKRFSLGKEILTLLIGILGTIIGFYYGSSDKAASPSSSGVDTIQADTVAMATGSREIWTYGRIMSGESLSAYSMAPFTRGRHTRVSANDSQNGVIGVSLNLSNALKSENVVLQRWVKRNVL